MTLLNTITAQLLFLKNTEGRETAARRWRWAISQILYILDYYNTFLYNIVELLEQQFIFKGDLLVRDG
jgi:hypothetical protein